MIEIVRDAIDPGTLIQLVRSTTAGAVVLFLGTAREFTAGRRTESLDYEALEPLARSEMQRLESAARQRWPLAACAIVHRVGHLELGDISIGVAVSSAHRAEAFAAGQWLIDRLKETVPIWKRENWSDGLAEWVHPTSGELEKTPWPTRADAPMGPLRKEQP